MSTPQGKLFEDAGPLAEGTLIPTMLGGQVRVCKLLGSGGQGHVYTALYNGRRKALKWYRPSAFYDREKFMRNLRGNIMKGSPTDEFLWPQDMTAMMDGTFGYIMDLCPNGYYVPDDFFNHRQGAVFPSYRRAIDACLGVVNAFRILHNEGYSYQDISGGNFFIHPQTGKVLICDNDNVAPNGTETGIRGTPRYMAPEIVCNLRRTPNTQSDRHSMSVLIFMLLLMNHPLEGRRMLDIALLDGAAQRSIYGDQALFVMDPDNHVNAPDPKVHRNVINVWPHLPSYMRELFLRAFSQQALHEPSHRPSEADWIGALARFRSEVTLCTSCHQNELFLDGAAPVRCERCGRVLSVPMRIEVGGQRLPVVEDARIYRFQTTICDANEALVPLARVVSAQNRSGVWGLHNISQETWEIKSGPGKGSYGPGKVVFAQPGVAFKLGDETLRIKDNRTA